MNALTTNLFLTLLFRANGNRRLPDTPTMEVPNLRLVKNLLSKFSIAAEPFPGDLADEIHANGDWTFQIGVSTCHGARDFFCTTESVDANPFARGAINVFVGATLKHDGEVFSSPRFLSSEEKQ